MNARRVSNRIWGSHRDREPLSLLPRLNADVYVCVSHSTVGHGWRSGTTRPISILFHYAQEIVCAQLFLAHDIRVAPANHTYKYFVHEFIILYFYCI